MKEKPAPPSRWLMIFSSLFITALVVSNIVAVKLIALGPLVLPAGVIVFPISYILGDVLTEVYGYAIARRIIWTGFFANLVAVIFIAISIHIPPVQFWQVNHFSSAAESQQAFAAVLGFSPRLLVASFTAYLVGEFLNAFVMARLKVKTRGRFLWVRTIGSTIVGEGADSFIFIAVAFGGLYAAPALLGTALSQWVFKTGYEILATPITYWVINHVKKAENMDVFDEKTNFNPLKF